MIFKFLTIFLALLGFSLYCQSFDSQIEQSTIQKSIVKPKKFHEIGELPKNSKILNIFDGKTFEEISAFYKNLPTSNKSFPIDKLIYDILISKVSFEEQQLSYDEDKQIFEIRVNKLFEMGKFQDIDSFYDQMPVDIENEALNFKRIEAYLLRNEFKNACELQKSLTIKKSYEWGKLEIICNIVDQDFEKARFSLSLLKEFSIPGNNLFIDLAYKIIGDIEISDEKIYSEKLRELKTLTPVLLSSLQIAEVSPSYENIKDSPINQLIFILSSPSSSTEIKLYCAERLVRLKRIEPQILAEVYQLSIFSSEEVQNVFELYKTFSPVRSRALLYQATIIEKDPDTKFKLIQLLLNQSKRENLFRPMALLLANSLDYHDLELSNEDEKSLILDIFLSNSQYLKAQSYIDKNKELSLLKFKEIILDLLIQIDDNPKEGYEKVKPITKTILPSNLPKKMVENYLIIDSIMKKNGKLDRIIPFTEVNPYKLEGDMDLIDFLLVVNEKSYEKDFELLKVLLKIIHEKDFQELSNLEAFSLLKIIEYFTNFETFREISKDLLLSQI